MIQSLKSVYKGKYVSNLYYISKFKSSETHHIPNIMDYGRPVRKWPSLHDQKSNPNPKFLGTAEAHFVCHIGPNFQISLIYAFIGCP